MASTGEIVTLFERLGELIDATHVEVVHDYEDTCYRLEMAGGIKVLLPPESLMDAKSDEDWHEFLRHVKRREDHE